jgi:hypothetical protein
LNNLDTFLTVAWLKIVLRIQVSNMIMNGISLTIAKDIVEKSFCRWVVKKAMLKIQSHADLVAFLLQLQ